MSGTPRCTKTERRPCHYFIPDYACQLFKGLRTYFDMTSDAVFVRQMRPNSVTQLQWFLDRRTMTGLVRTREYTSLDNPMTYITCGGATINPLRTL